MRANLLLLLLAAPALPGVAMAQQCSLTEQCTGALTTGACGYTDAVCMPPPGGSGSCSRGGAGNCSGTYNCQPPIATAQGVQLIPAGGGTYTARLPVDVVAPFNSWAIANSPPGTLQVLWYDAATVPDICNGNVASSLCSFANGQQVGTHFGTDHGLTWLDKNGLTCAGAPYDFVVSALFSTCQQPSCACEQQFGNPNCLCFASTSTTLNNLHLTIPKSVIPGRAPPPQFCSEGAGAG
ncbi:MAG: hypothetical protein JOZ15_12035, partial [Acidobacteria bacterium]|nr:hypothetical protein [Acidobacteriota bacterium]